MKLDTRGKCEAEVGRQGRGNPINGVVEGGEGGEGLTVAPKVVLRGVLGGEGKEKDVHGLEVGDLNIQYPTGNFQQGIKI